MMIIFNCAEEQKEKVTLTLENIQKFLKSNEMNQILRSFDIVPPQAKSTIELVDEMLKISDIWDFRKRLQTLDTKTGENMRWMVSDDIITENQYEIIMKCVGKLGLCGRNDPLAAYYDYILVLGGARYSALYRNRYATQILEKLDKRPKAIVLLAGNRLISDTEREATDTYAVDATTEFDLMNKGAELSFNLSQDFMEERHDYENNNESYAVRHYVESSGVPIISLSAPSSEPEKRRANSVDTYRYFAKVCMPEKKSKILLITSEIYVPYQQIEAIRTLAIPEDIIVEMIGYPNEWTGSLPGMRLASNYLQELRSTIQAMHRFVQTDWRKI